MATFNYHNYLDPATFSLFLKIVSGYFVFYHIIPPTRACRDYNIYEGVQRGLMENRSLFKPQKQESFSLHFN